MEHTITMSYNHSIKTVFDMEKTYYLCLNEDKNAVNEAKEESIDIEVGDK